MVWFKFVCTVRIFFFKFFFFLVSRYLYALGQRVWKRWKRRYCVLVQVSARWSEWKFEMYFFSISVKTPSVQFSILCFLKWIFKFSLYFFLNKTTLSMSVAAFQVSQYTFAMCSYREKKSEPHELMQLDGYTVDYSDPQPGELVLLSSLTFPVLSINTDCFHVLA